MIIFVNIFQIFKSAAAGKNDNSSPRPGIASRIGGDGERNSKSLSHKLYGQRFGSK